MEPCPQIAALRDRFYALDSIAGTGHRNLYHKCIDCGVCEPECPAEAILPDSDPGAGPWLEHNRTRASQWPNITRKGIPPDDAEAWKGVGDKFARFFSPKPAATAR